MSVNPGLSFPGLQSLQNIHAADTVVAANASYVVEVVNANIGIWNKTNGTLVSQEPLQSFFAPVAAGYNPAHFFDVNAIYDNQAGRFVVSSEYRIVATPTTPEFNRLLFTVSDSSNPTAGFSMMQNIDLVEQSATLGTLHGDNPRLGYNADAYTVAMNMHTATAQSAGVKLITIQKSSVLNGSNSSFVYYQNDLPLPNDSFEPAMTNDASPGAPQWLATTINFNTLDLIKETNELSSAPTLTTYAMTIPTYGRLVRSSQPGTTNTIDTGGDLSVAQRGNRIVVVQEVGTSGVTQARWYDFNIGGSSPHMTQWGQLNPGPGVFTYDGSANIAPNGDLGFCYMQSAANQYMSLYVTAQEPGATAGLTDPPVLVAAGTVPYMSTRNGDYTQVAIDPVTGGFWAAGQYAFPGSPSVTNNWATYISQFGTSSATHLGVSAGPAIAGLSTNVTVTALDGPSESPGAAATENVATND
jgi:hypothetical protein